MAPCILEPTLAAVTVARCARVVVEPGARVTGAATGWQADDEITLFDSVGFALADLALEISKTAGTG